MKPDDLVSLFILRVALSTLAIVIGVAGFAGVWRIARTADVHILRARAARKSLGFLEPFATGGEQFLSLRLIYLTFNVIVVVLGIVLLLAAVLTRCAA